jgi:amyloid beta precursor protein binding protein 1
MYALISALESFIEKNNRAPLRGTIPDMTASTNLYVQLQKLYHDQAVKDVQEFTVLLGSDSGIPTDEVQSFCRNVHALDLLHTRTLEQEYSAVNDDELLDEWNMALMDPYEVPEQTPFLWYIALKAANDFYTKYNRYPGTIENYLEDVDPLQECVVKVVKEMKLEENELVQQTLLSLEKKYAIEMAREENAEVHNIASVLGGVASQEAVKIITGQYVPLNNTYIYNGIASTGGVYNV